MKDLHRKDISGAVIFAFQPIKISQKCNLILSRLPAGFDADPTGEIICSVFFLLCHGFLSDPSPNSATPKHHDEALNL